MSYNARLVDPVTGEELTLVAPHCMRGGTYDACGTARARVNVTYNYAPFFAPLGEGGLRSLDGKSAAETLPALRSLIASLMNDVDDNYWMATEGNAKRALCALEALARLRPDGVWSVT